MAAPRHPSLTSSYGDRAASATHPLTTYLLRLMELKQSNLCVSADVHSARELLSLADKVGPSIVVLKTHYDLVLGWDFNPQTGTGAYLAALARKHGFLIFEDRKYCDIGSTVQQQYVGGTARVIDWAHIVNANISAGKPMVGAMAEAAAKWRERINYEVRTSVTVGTPISDGFESDIEEMDEEEDETATARAGNGQRKASALETRDINMMAPPPPPRDADGRKGSIVSITTVTQSYEPADSPRLSKSLSDVDDIVFAGIEEAPLERGLLLLAQMSSSGNLMDARYTNACIEAARENKDFVMGYVAQESLNSKPDDNFIHMTPGCKLPPEGEEENGEDIEGDGMGQQYNTPSKLIGIKGTDIVIVGRGIIKAGDPQGEAERYRVRAWKAYTARLRN
ncbi:orotidine 5phosphate decarboxylase [Diaporthe amygdali]|uniref:orotidine 5phosphate decarboxylase n=1 Tax=Phomopsis amygdali TaxID=1214568 RepID=UPI0022FF18D0|nr:orotidine 5phosphate decarboxylase [Diaporthe amygdali]KAJ0125054.1 orotidine 5phosphate decarboxylase [Diaporthe amygdali]